MLSTSAEPPAYLSLHRLAQITGRNRATVLIRVKDGRLLPDAWLEVAPGRRQPLFLASSAIRPSPRLPSAHPLL